MIRLFITVPLAAAQSVPLSEAHTHYLLHVMRQRPGNQILVFNGQDGEWLCDIVELSKKKGLLQVKQQTQKQTALPPLTLCPALIKKENMDFVFQKATELGVTCIRPVLTQRTVVSRLNSERARLQTLEAAEQCERLSVPELFEPTPLRRLLCDLPADTVLVCLSERGKTTAPVPTNRPVAFLVGPEGGFTPEELDEIAQRPQTVFCHLGDTILRAETASVAILSCYRFRVF